MNMVAPPVFLIEILSGPEAGRVFQLLPPKVRIGRGTENDIVLTDLRVSREQLVLEFRSGQFEVKNISDKNVMRINKYEASHSILKDKDVLTIGGTKLRFRAKGAQKSLVSPGAGLGEPATARPAPHLRRPRSHAKSEAKSRRLVLFAVTGVLVLVALFSGDKKTDETAPIQTNQLRESSIEESRKRLEDLQQKRSFASEEERQRHETADEHYRRGFRDFKKRNYLRAMQAFQTALSVDPGHERASRYYQLADKSRQKSIDEFLLEGQRYWEKAMYDRCEASLRKAMVLINNPNDPKYTQAETLRKECRLRQEVW